MKSIREIADLMVAEAERAERRHGPHHASHHSFGVLMEEVDELWDEVKRDDIERAKLEAIQVGAMAIRFIRESAHWDNGITIKASENVQITCIGAGGGGGSGKQARPTRAKRKGKK